MSIHLDADEWPDSLIVSGPGVGVAMQIGLHEPYYSFQDVANLTLGCGYQYYSSNGGISPWNCDCIALTPSNAHGTLRLSWTFEQDPADALRLVVEQDTLWHQSDGAPWATRVQPVAVYSDGTDAPLSGNVEITAGTTQYGMLRRSYCGYGCTADGAGQSVEIPYEVTAYRADLVLNAPGLGPSCDTTVPLTATVNGLSASASVVIRGSRQGEPGTALDYIPVELYPMEIAPGDSSMIKLGALSTAACGPPVEVADSSEVAVTVVPADRGLLSYRGQRAQALRLPYTDIKDGELHFVANEEAACDSSSVEILVASQGLYGRGSLAIVDTSSSERSSIAGRTLCPDGDCGCSGSLVESESRQSIIDWYVEECGWPQNPAADSINFAYERSIANFLFEGLGAGQVSRYLNGNGQIDTNGLDGYQTWYFDYDRQRLYDYISLIMESKLTESEPIFNETRIRQAERQIQLLADERDRFVAAYPALYYWGTPIYVYFSQSRGSEIPTGGRTDPWLLGQERPTNNYNQRILDFADSLNVPVLHAHIHTVFDIDVTRHMSFRFMNDVSLIHPGHPFLAWLDDATTVALQGVTFTYPKPFRFRCDALDWDKNRPPPGGIIP